MAEVALAGALVLVVSSAWCERLHVRRTCIHRCVAVATRVACHPAVADDASAVYS